jgi:hypothetical protein
MVIVSESLFLVTFSFVTMVTLFPAAFSFLFANVLWMLFAPFQYFPFAVQMMNEAGPSSVSRYGRVSNLVPCGSKILAPVTPLYALPFLRSLPFRYLACAMARSSESDVGSVTWNGTTSPTASELHIITVAVAGIVGPVAWCSVVVTERVGKALPL